MKMMNVVIASTEVTWPLVHRNGMANC